MKKRFTEEQIIRMLKAHEGGRATSQKIMCLFLFVVILLASCNKTKQHDPVKQALVENLTSLAEIKTFDDISASIYWISPFIHTRYPWPVDVLINFNQVKLIKLEGAELEGKLDWFKNVTEEDIELVDQKIHVQARFYVLIESPQQGKHFELILFGYPDYLIVNDVLIEKNDKLLNAILPLLDEQGMLDLELYRRWNN